MSGSGSRNSRVGRSSVGRSPSTTASAAASNGVSPAGSRRTWSANRDQFSNPCACAMKNWASARANPPSVRRAAIARSRAPASIAAIARSTLSWTKGVTGTRSDVASARIQSAAHDRTALASLALPELARQPERNVRPPPRCRSQASAPPRADARCIRRLTVPIRAGGICAGALCAVRDLPNA
jgi:hypothetical protein